MSYTPWSQMSIFKYWMEVKLKYAVKDYYANFVYHDVANPVMCNIFFHGITSQPHAHPTMKPITHVHIVNISASQHA